MLKVRVFGRPDGRWGRGEVHGARGENRLKVFFSSLVPCPSPLPGRKVRAPQGAVVGNAHPRQRFVPRREPPTGGTVQQKDTARGTGVMRQGSRVREFFSPLVPRPLPLSHR